MALLLLIPSCKGSGSSQTGGSAVDMNSITDKKIRLSGDGTHVFLDLEDAGYRWIQLDGMITKREAPSFKGIRSHAMSHNGQFLALVMSDSEIELHWTDQVRYMDVSIKGRILQAIPDNRGSRLIVLSRDGEDSYLTVWDVEKGGAVVTRKENIPLGEVKMYANGNLSLLSLRIFNTSQGTSTVNTYNWEGKERAWKSLARTEGYTVPVFAQGRVWLPQDGKIIGRSPGEASSSFAGGETSGLQVGPTGNHILRYDRKRSKKALDNPLDAIVEFAVINVNPVQEGAGSDHLIRNYSNKVFFLDKQNAVKSATLNDKNELTVERIR